jgi:hypothetical protein
VGAFQIRTVKQSTGTRTLRDIVLLQGNLDAQAAAAYSISARGKDFSAWSVYTSGKYQSFLGQAQAVVGTADASLTAASSSPLASLLPDPAHILKQLRDMSVEGLVLVAALGLVAAGLVAAVSPRIAATARKALP